MKRASLIVNTLASHGREYAFEAIELGLFMISASVFALLLFHPSSPIVDAIHTEWLRRLLMGLAMGGTAIALIYSPMGRRSGAHMNPAVTLTFLRLGKIAPIDALFYITAQFFGGTLAMLTMRAVAGGGLMDGTVKYVATIPAGERIGQIGAAWLVEFIIAGVLMTVVLNVSNRRSLMRYTGLFAGALVATYIFVAAPISGMSMNPARTFASAIVGHVWTAWWIYFTAPPLAMLLAAQMYVSSKGRAEVYCAKMYHDHDSPCIFRCRFHELCAATDTNASEIGKPHPRPLSQGERGVAQRAVLVNGTRP